MKKMLICVCALSLLFGACSIFCTGCGGCSDEELVLTIDEGKSTNVQTNNGDGKSTNVQTNDTVKAQEF